MEILNVDHGFCAYAVGSDGGVILFDCGHGSANRPSTYLPAHGITSIRRFFVTNYDEDHISDLLAVRQNLYIEVLTRNTSMTSAQIRSLKTRPISPAMTELLGMIDSYTWSVTAERLEPVGLRIRLFHNDYPTFTDTNNLSLLTFLDVGDVILFKSLRPTIGYSPACAEQVRADPATYLWAFRCFIFPAMIARARNGSGCSGWARAHSDIA